MPNGRKKKQYWPLKTSRIKKYQARATWNLAPNIVAEVGGNTVLADRIRRKALRDRSLDIVRKNPNLNLAWADRFTSNPRSITRSQIRVGTKYLPKIARGARAATSTRLLGILGPAIGKAVGFGADMLIPSPLADGTRAAVGREMLRRQRMGKDPFFSSAGRFSPHERRRAETFMGLGINPLRPGVDKWSGKPIRYAGDMTPNAPLGSERHWVFEPEIVHRSPTIHYGPREAAIQGVRSRPIRYARDVGPNTPFDPGAHWVFEPDIVNRSRPTFPNNRPGMGARPFGP